MNVVIAMLMLLLSDCSHGIIPALIGRRQSTGSGPEVDDPMVIDAARASANSCNAVVRAVAQSLLNLQVV